MKRKKHTPRIAYLKEKLQEYAELAKEESIKQGLTFNLNLSVPVKGERYRIPVPDVCDKDGSPNGQILISYMEVVFAALNESYLSTYEGTKETLKECLDPKNKRSDIPVGIRKEIAAALEFDDARQSFRMNGTDEQIERWKSVFGPIIEQNQNTRDNK